MARQTRDEKRAAEKLADAARRVADYKARIEKLHTMLVVETSNDVFKLQEHVESPLFGRRAEANVLYCAISRVEQARTSFASEMGWLRRAVEDAERNIANRACYSGAVVGARGCDVDAANARLYTALESARDVCRLLDVYCPQLVQDYEAKNRAARMAMRVEEEPRDGCHFAWTVRDADGSVPAAIAAVNASGDYDTEEDAWRAFAAAVGDTI